jgi:hypothetical protein
VLPPKAICALDPASQLPAPASGTGKVRGDRASHTDTAADEVLMRDNLFLHPRMEKEGRAEESNEISTDEY